MQLLFNAFFLSLGLFLVESLLARRQA